MYQKPSVIHALNSHRHILLDFSKTLRLILIEFLKITYH